MDDFIVDIKLEITETDNEQHTLSGLDYGGDEEQVISIEEATNDNN